MEGFALYFEALQCTICSRGSMDKNQSRHGQCLLQLFNMFLSLTQSIHEFHCVAASLASNCGSTEHDRK